MKIKYSSRRSNKWSVDAGRILCYEGKSLVYIGIVRDDKTGSHNLPPAEADDLTKFIAFLLNEEGATPERGPVIIHDRIVSN